MTAHEILQRLSADGIGLEAEGTMLRASPRKRLRDEHLRLIRAHGPELLALLTRKPVLCVANEGRRTSPRAAHVYDVEVIEPASGSTRWFPLIVPSADMQTAWRTAQRRFGPVRVLELVPHGPTAAAPCATMNMTRTSR